MSLVECGDLWMRRIHGDVRRREKERVRWGALAFET